MKHFISYPFWINEVACWSDLKSLNGPVGTENRGVAVFTHRDITQLIESTFIRIRLQDEFFPIVVCGKTRPKNDLICVFCSDQSLVLPSSDRTCFIALLKYL